MSSFFEQFKMSPVSPLCVHLDKVMECVALVRPMFEAVCKPDYDRLEALTHDVFKVEHEADTLKAEIRQSIPRTFYLPVFRGDLLGYLKLQDDMADAAEDLAVLLTVKQRQVPAAIADQTLDYVDSCVRVCKIAAELGAQFRDVVDGGFGTEKIDSVLEKVREVERAEWEADRKQYKLSQSLLKLEDSASAVDLMLWFKTFGKLGKLANHAEDLADRVRRMIASRYS